MTLTLLEQPAVTLLTRTHMLKLRAEFRQRFGVGNIPRVVIRRTPSPIRHGSEGNRGGREVGAALLQPPRKLHRLLHPLRHLRLIPRVALMQVEVAHLLALALSRRHRLERGAAEEADLDVALEDMKAEEEALPFDAVER